MGLQRLITEFCPKPHSVSEISVLEAPNGAGGAPVEPVDLRQKFITEFCPVHTKTSPRAQLTLTGDIIPVKSVESNERSADRNARLFHFYDDPSPVLTVSRSHIIRSDQAHIKIPIPKDLQQELDRCGKVEVWHFASIKEEHSYNVEERYLRIATGRFYTGFYDSSETALVKMEGERVFIVTKVGHHPRDYILFRNVEYKNATGSVPMVKTTKGRIVPLSFYVQALKQFPSVVEVIGKARKVRVPKKMKERRFISTPED